MSVLTNGEINPRLRALVLSPDGALLPGALWPASVVLRLDPVIFVPKLSRAWASEAVDLRQPDDEWFETKEIGPAGYLLEPHRPIIGRTFERLVVPGDLVARVDGLPANAAWCLHVQADPGPIWPGYGSSPRDPGAAWPVQIRTTFIAPLRLYALMPICQISWTRLRGAVWGPPRVSAWPPLSSGAGDAAVGTGGTAS